MLLDPSGPEDALAAAKAHASRMHYFSELSSVHCRHWFSAGFSTVASGDYFASQDVPQTWVAVKHRDLHHQARRLGLLL